MKSNDIEIIKQIETLTGVSLKQVGHTEIEFNGTDGLKSYSVNYQGNITGLCLDYLILYESLVSFMWSDFFSLKSMTSLKTLSLGGNEIIDCSFLKYLPGLTTLYLSENEIIDCGFLKYLPGLTTLYLSDNEIVDCSFLKYLSGLTTLYLNDNKIIDCSALKDLGGLTTLDLGGNKITDCFSLEYLSGLTTLYLNDNKITDCSALKDLSDLTTLNLSNNKITDCSALKDLRGLTVLDLSDNKITDCSALNCMTGLTTFNFRRNKITDFSFLKDLTSLTALDLSDSNISDFSFLKNLVGLTTLDLSNNKIIDCSFLKGLTGLMKLNLESNEITDCSFINELPHLYGIDLGYNPIRKPPIEIVNKGIVGIHNYFRQIKEQECVAVYEAKLLFVGEPGSGKTSLMNKLLDPLYIVPNDDSASTLGVNVHTGWKFPYCKDSSVGFAANLWDFGGQEIQYMLHQFFLTPRSVYVLLVDDRKQHTQFDYWFNIITLLSEAGRYEKTPVFVVLNEINHQSITNFDYNDYCNRYPELDIKCQDVDLSKDDARFETVKQKICELLSSLSHIGDKLPAQWLPIREELVGMKSRNHIKVEEFFAVCQKHKLTKEEDMLLLVGYLHDLGVVFHFTSDSSLADMVFLNPQWTVDAVYIALSDKTLETQKGKFTRDWIFGLWETKGYTFEERNKFLQLMLKDNFELCYRIDNSSDEYIAPQLLPSIRPALTIPVGNKNLRFRILYPFMPEGILWRLIVRKNDCIATHEGDGLVWSGV